MSITSNVNFAKHNQLSSLNFFLFVRNTKKVQKICIFDKNLVVLSYKTTVTTSISEMLKAVVHKWQKLFTKIIVNGRVKLILQRGINKFFSQAFSWKLSKTIKNSFFIECPHVTPSTESNCNKFVGLKSQMVLKTLFPSSYFYKRL